MALSVGDSIKAEPNGTVNVTLLSMADTLASFSSRGPVRGLGQIKPDISAPGVAVVNIDNGYGAGHLAAQIAAPA